jgi:hypothetical protein
MKSNEHVVTGIFLLGDEGRFPGIQHVAERAGNGQQQENGASAPCLPTLGLHAAEHLKLDVRPKSAYGILLGPMNF